MLIDQVPHSLSATELLVTAHSFLLVEKIPAAIQNQSTFENFDCFHVMRGVSVNESNTFFNQTMGERDLVRRNVIPPVASPVNRRDEQIAWLLKALHGIRNPAGRRS